MYAVIDATRFDSLYFDANFGVALNRFTEGHKIETITAPAESAAYRLTQRIYSVIDEEDRARFMKVWAGDCANFQTPYNFFLYRHHDGYLYVIVGFYKPNALEFHDFLVDACGRNFKNYFENEPIYTGE